MLASLARFCCPPPMAGAGRLGGGARVVMGSAGAIGDGFVDNPEPPSRRAATVSCLLDDHFADVGSGASGSVVVLRSSRASMIPRSPGRCRRCSTRWTRSTG